MRPLVFQVFKNILSSKKIAVDTIDTGETVNEDGAMRRGLYRRDVAPTRGGADAGGSNLKQTVCRYVVLVLLLGLFLVASTASRHISSA